MLRFILRRLLTGFPVIWAAATLTFIAIHLLPGDPITQQLARAGAPPEVIAARRAALGWDRPLLVQYGEFLWDTVRGNWGRSWVSQQPVIPLLRQAAGPTLELAGVALAIAITVGMTLGTVAALRPGTWIDALSMLVALSGISLPIAWSGLLAILLFSVILGWLPPGGTGGMRYALLPGLVLGLAAAGALARLLRANVLQVLAENYVVTARAKGLPPRLVILRHVWTNALPPAVALLAVQAGFLMGGAAITEMLYARQGLGRLMVEAVLAQDLPVVQGLIIGSAATYSLVNLLADVVHWQLDPRLRD